MKKQFWANYFFMLLIFGEDKWRKGLEFNFQFVDVVDCQQFYFFCPPLDLFLWTSSGILEEIGKKIFLFFPCLVGFTWVVMLGWWIQKRAAAVVLAAAAPVVQSGKRKREREDTGMHVKRNLLTHVSAAASQRQVRRQQQLKWSSNGASQK